MSAPKTIFHSVKLAVTSLAALAIGASGLYASPIPYTGSGQVNASNMDGVLVSVSSSPMCIAFSGNATTCSATATPILTSGGDPIFATGNGTIADIGTTFPITAFKTAPLTVAGGPAIWDLLNIIVPTGFAACTTTTTAGSCSTGTFVLSQVSPTQVSITLSTNERGYIGSSATGSTPYVGVFTTQLSGNLNAFGCTGANCADTIGNVLLWESTPGHVINSTWSASESPVPVPGVPEPASMVLFGSALLSLAFLRRSRKLS